MKPADRLYPRFLKHPRENPLGSLQERLNAVLRRLELAAGAESPQRLLQPLHEWDRLQRGLPRHQVHDLEDVVKARLAELKAARPENGDGAKTWIGLRGFLLGLRARCHLAQLLSAHRHSTGMTLRDVSARANLAQPYLGQIETCAAGLPSIERAQLLLELLQLPLWGDRGPRALPPDRPPAIDPTRQRRVRRLLQALDRLSTTQLEVLAHLAEQLAEPVHHDHDFRYPPLGEELDHPGDSSPAGG